MASARGWHPSKIVATLTEIFVEAGPCAISSNLLRHISMARPEILYQPKLPTTAFISFIGILLVDGESCEQACINNPYDGFDCTKADPRNLYGANYSCFEPFLVNDVSQPLMKTCITSYASNSPATPSPP